MINKNNYMYKNSDKIYKIFNEFNILKREMVTLYCGAGIAATNIAFTLTILGYNKIKVYDSSLNEWARNEIFL